ncbi:MAG: VWA domain-containing protein, partial [Bacteroidota bacterium]|nr:VWA domain-containing protein [Bacteroidota bacterium]
MQRVILESAPEFLILCLIAGVGYAALQYFKTKHPWTKRMNTLLFAFRATLAFFLAFLLLGPIVKQISNIFEKPAFIVIHDNSSSVAETTDSLTRLKLQQEMQQTVELLEENGYDAEVNTLSDDNAPSFDYDATTSDINGALKRVANRYEGKNVAGVILVSDGIYNAGLSPLYSSYNFPVYTLGVGDTTVRADIALKNIAYNKIAYQGNKFPLRAEVQVKNIASTTITATLLKRGKVLEKQTKNVVPGQLLTYDFQPLADEQGIQKYDIQIETRPEEHNTKNNRSSVFVEVVEGRKKILCIAAAPHPDIKAIREVITKNSNYEFILHIPDVNPQQASTMVPEKIDLVIFHQSPDLRGKTTALFQTFMKSKSSVFIILGHQTDLRQLARHDLPLQFESPPREYDEVTPVVNPALTNFNISSEASSAFASFPPVSVHFGKMRISAGISTVLFQRVGSVTTDKPLLVLASDDAKKIGVMLGEGMWRWRLNEFDRTENTLFFDEVFGKLIQFLSTTEDKRKFRSYPVRQDFSDTEPVVFESQVYNDIFEPVYGNSVEIDITHEDGRRTNYTYVISPGNTRYQIGGLKEGVYRYRASTVLGGKTESVRGEFAVVERQAELQNLTADFDLLRRLSGNTGGKFYTAAQADNLRSDLQKTQATSVIHTEETYDSMINLKWVFWLLLILVTAEWGLR